MTRYITGCVSISVVLCGIEFTLRSALLNPAHAAAHTDLGVLPANSGDFLEAVAHFRNALRAKPGDPLAAMNLETTLRHLSECPRMGMNDNSR